VGRALNIFSDRFDPKSPQNNVVSPLEDIRDSPVGAVGGAEEAKEVEVQRNGDVDLAPELDQVSGSPTRGASCLGVCFLLRL
jgi:hypothetical protein